MTALEFWTDDDRFGLRMPEELVTRMITWCAAADTRETGGILIGHYTAARDCAEVSDVTGPPRDSRAGRTWFIRGVTGLQRQLRSLWRAHREYYVGEWHFHPHGPPSPSSTDTTQMIQIAEAKQYHCPEPLLVLVGGSPPTNFEIRVFVYPRHRVPAELKPIYGGSYPDSYRDEFHVIECPPA